MRLIDAQTLLSRLVADGGTRVERDIAYGPQPRHRLDVYRPALDTASVTGGPLCIFYYGGGWKSGERSAYSFVGAALAAHGFTTVIADYRLFPENPFPDFVEDCAAAYRHVAATIAAPGQALVVAGHSAGAYNAALMTLDPAYLDGVVRRPSGLIVLSGPVAFEPTTWPSTAAIFAAAPNVDAPRPVVHVSAASPPALSLHGAADTLVKPWNQRELVAAYGRAGRPIRALELPGLGHIEPLLAIARPLRWRAPVLDEMLGFLRGSGRS